MAKLDESVRLGCAWALMTLLTVGGCDCNKGPAVPFKHPDGVPEASRTDADKQTASSSADAAVRMGERFVDAPNRVDVADGTLEKKGGHIHATLSTGDGKTDVLALVSDRSGRLAVERATRASRPGLLPLTAVLELVPSERSCTFLAGGLDALSSTHLHASATLSCQQASPEGSEDQSPAEPEIVQSHWLLT